MVTRRSRPRVRLRTGCGWPATVLIGAQSGIVSFCTAGTDGVLMMLLDAVFCRQPVRDDRVVPLEAEFSCSAPGSHATAKIYAHIH